MADLICNRSPKRPPFIDPQHRRRRTNLDPGTRGYVTAKFLF
jgi:hypothetical protein